MIFNILQFIHIYGIDWAKKAATVQELSKERENLELFDENNEKGFKKFKNSKLLIKLGVILLAFLIFVIGLSTHFIYSFNDAHHFDSHFSSHFNYKFSNNLTHKAYLLKPLSQSLSSIEKRNKA